VQSANSEGESRRSWQRPDAPLGTLIFREGLLSAEQLEDALSESVKHGKRLGQVLVERGLLAESQVARILAKQKGLEYVDLEAIQVDPAAAALLAPETAQSNNAVPVALVDGVPLIAVEDPGDEDVLQAVKNALGSEPRFAVAPRGEILRVLDNLYGEGGNGLAGGLVSASEPVDEPAANAQPEPVAAPEPFAAPEPPAEPVSPEPAAPVSLLRVAAVPDPEPVSVPEAAPEPEPVVQAEPEPVVVEPEPELEPEPEPELAPVAEPVELAPSEPEPEPEPAMSFLPESSPEPEPAEEVVPEPEPVPAPEPVPVPTFVDVVGPALPADPDPEPEPEQAAEVVPEPEPVSVQEAAPEPAFVDVVAPAAPTEPEVDPEPEPEAVEEEPEAVPEAPIPLRVAEPAPEPEPELELALEPVASESEEGVRLVVRLSDGSDIDLGSFSTSEEAKGAAKLLSRQIASAAPGDWPELGGRFVRPELIVSIDVA
jgi:hypothetical protein